jgi:superfamily II DNA/RNA helicase
MEGSLESDSPRLDSNVGRGKYNSVNSGRQLCNKILAKYVTYDPHTYILDGICPVLDGFDLVATMPTGSGKTGI